MARQRSRWWRSLLREVALGSPRTVLIELQLLSLTGFAGLTYRLFGALGVVAVLLVLIPVALAFWIRIYLYGKRTLKASDRRYLMERLLKTSILAFIGLGLIVILHQKAGPTLPVLLASITALGEWNILAESFVMFLKYHNPQRYGDD